MTLSDKWLKSQRSMENGNCVEVRLSGDRVEVRDSQNPPVPLTFGRVAFSEFIRSVADREFDLC